MSADAEVPSPTDAECCADDTVHCRHHRTTTCCYCGEDKAATAQRLRGAPVGSLPEPPRARCKSHLDGRRCMYLAEHPGGHYFSPLRPPLSDRVPEPATAAECFALALQVYRPEGVCLWMTAPNKLLDGQRPCDLLERGETAPVAALLDMLASGAFL